MFFRTPTETLGESVFGIGCLVKRTEGYCQGNFFFYLNDAGIIIYLLFSFEWHSMAPTLCPNPPHQTTPLFSPGACESLPCTISGEQERGKTNKQGLFPEFMFSKGDWGEGRLEAEWGWEGVCGWRLKTVAVTRRDLCILLAKVKQIDPGCRFTCVFARLPVNLPCLSSPISVPRR